MRVGAAITAVGMAVIALGTAPAAWAACTTLAFSVNDYGKDGPSKDAKDLLEKYAAKWTADHGIKKFTVGQKQVSCELFLNFVLFDEHTCTATANVCWEGAAPTGVTTATAAPLLNKAAAKKSATAAAPAGASPIATGAVKAAAPKAAAAKANAPAAAVVAPGEVAAPATPVAPTAVVVPPVAPSAAPAAAPVAAPAATAN